MRKTNKKKVTAILFMIALLIAIFPDVQSDTLSSDKPSPDYGVYSALEGIQDEKNARINSPEILNETHGRFDNMTIITGEEKLDLQSRREVVSPDIPVPEMLPIYEIMKEWDSFHNNQVVDWILPPPLGSGTPLNYYIYTRYLTNTSIIEKWRTANLRRTAIYPEPNITNWWGVDVDNDTTDDIEVFFDPRFSGITLNDIIERVTSGEPIGISVTFHYNIHKINNAPFDAPDFVNLEVFVAKSMSYSDQNFLIFIGMNLTNVVTYMNTSANVNKVRLDNLNYTIQWLPPPPSISFDFGDIVNLVGPYSMGWDSGNEVMPSLGYDIATARLEFFPDDTYEFLNRSWVDVDLNKSSPYDTVPTSAEMWMDADNTLSSFDEIRWTASHICDASIRFFDSQKNLTYAELEIDDLPKEMDALMNVEQQDGRNITIIDYEASSIMKRVKVHHYEYFDTSYENITRDNIDSGKVEYIHLYMNITNIPRRLFLKGVFYLEEIEGLPPLSPGIELAGQLINAIAHRVISRFTRIAKTLSSIPYRLLSIAEEGGLAEFHTYGQDDIDEVEFIYTSGDYITTTENYFAFYHNTRSSDYPIAQISLSGKMKNIAYFNSSFEDENAFAEVRMMNGQEFRAIYTDYINSLDAELILSNVPGNIKVSEIPGQFSYNGDGTIVDEVRFLSDYLGAYMDFRITDVADQINMEFDDVRTHIDSGPTQKKIGDIEFVFTTGPIYRMDGNYLLIRQLSNFSLLSGRIKDISSLDYISGENGKIDLNFTQENPMNLTLLDNRTELLSADMIIDPLPKMISANLADFLPTDYTNIPLPKLESTGILGVVSVIFGIATMGNEILQIVDETTQNALNNIGNIITNLTFSYRTDTHTTVIGRIVRGDTYTLNDVDWVHGISAQQKVTSSETAMAAKIYFSGLPTETSIITQIQGDDIFLYLDIVEYMPKHDWLCIDVRGLQDRDVLLYLNDINQGMDLDLRVDLNVSLNTIPQSAVGSIYMNSDKSIGSLFARMRQTAPEITITEMFLSSLPRDLETNFNLSGNVSIDYKANRDIEYMFVKNTRTRNGKFHDIYAIAHELPNEFVVNVFPVTDYDMDGSLLQTLPSLSLSSSGGTLDAFVFADGKAIGQIGVVEVQVVNVPVTLSGKFTGDKYRFESAGVDYLWLHVMELPVMEDHRTKSLEIVGKDLKSFDVTVDNLFGNYPIIGMENSKGGEIQFVVDHEAEGSKAGFAIIDFKTKDGLPQSPSILINGGSVDLDKGSSHVMVPAPVLSMFLSIFS
ncbi:MAG: hypothetical protein JSV09_16815 [Thermoplasmata archaeon]|nr:MAG: hypothetical protein JSV09_16815 [Thermoplasmata archaeon]